MFVGVLVPAITLFFFAKLSCIVSMKLILLVNVKMLTITSVDILTFEPRYEKTGFLHMRKQRRRSAVQ